MDFDYINKLIETLNTANVFKYSFVGAKVLAFALLLFRILDAFVKDSTDGQIKVGNLFSLFGYALIIMSSDWIIDSIEHIFSSVDNTMQLTPSSTYDTINIEVIKQWEAIFDSASDWWDYINIFFASILQAVMLLIVYILALFLKLADMSITASYLIQRIFIIQLLKFLFPLAVALSTFSGTAKFFYSWILRYIGTFILGIAYIGIIKFTELVIQVMLGEMNGDSYGYSFSIGVLIVGVTIFTVKVKLLHSVTSYIYGMFQ